MGNQITVVMSAEDANVVAAWQRQRDNVGLFEESIKKAHETSTGFADRFKDGLKDVGHEMVASFAGLEGAKKGIELLEEAYGEWTKKIKENLKAQQENRQELTATLAMAGKLSDAPMIEEGLKHIAGATRAEKKAAFVSIAEAAPTLSAKEQLSLAELVAPLGGVVGEKGVAELGRFTGTLATAAPERSAFDLSNIAMAAGGQVTAARRGELADPSTLKTLGILEHQGGMSLEKALAFETTAMQKGLGAKDVEKFADALLDPMEEERHHPHKGHEGILRYRFANMDLEHRREALLHDKDMAQAILKNREATRFAEIGTGADWARNEEALLAAHKGTGRNADLIAEQEAIHSPDSVRRKIAMQKEAHFSEEADEREPFEMQMELGKEQLLHKFGRNWFTEFVADKGAGMVDAAHGLIPKSGREWMRAHHIDMSTEDLRQYANFDETSRQVEEGAHGEHAGHSRPTQTGHGYVEGGPGDHSIVMPPGGGAPIVNGHPAPERLSSEMLHHAERQTQLLEKLVDKTQPVAINVHPPAPSRGPRINAVERDHVSPSAVLGANH